MNDNTTEQVSDLFEKIVAKTQSDLILFFIIVAIVVLVIMPLIFTFFLNRQKKDIEKIKVQAGLESGQFRNWTDRERNLLQVIKENSDKSEKVAEAITKLSTVLQIDNSNCDSCKREQIALWKLVLTKLDTMDEESGAFQARVVKGIDDNWVILKDIKQEVIK